MNKLLKRVRETLATKEDLIPQTSLTAEVEVPDIKKQEAEVKKYEVVRSDIMETLLLEVVNGQIRDFIAPEDYSGAKPLIRVMDSSYELSWETPTKAPKVFGILATPWSTKESRALMPVIRVADSTLRISFTNGNIELLTNFWLILHTSRIRVVPVGNFSRVI